MKARDVMTKDVVSIESGAPVLRAAQLMLQNRISGLPVIDAKGQLVGIVTEGDFLRRGEIGTQRRRPRWLEFLVGPGRLATEYVRACGRKVDEIMTTDLYVVTPDTPLAEVVQVMEKRRIKRVPVVENGKVVGIVSRANLMYALASLARDAKPSASALFSHYLVNWSCESTRSVVLQRIFDDLRRALMPTECNPELFGFAPVEGREVVAAFDAGAITSDAGALLLGATDRAIGMMDRFASCFHDVRCPEFIEHEVVTLVGQRVFGIALGYEDLNDHDELRHDPLMAVLAGKLEARRQDCAPVAGKSTLNRLELSCLEPTRYHKISHNPVAIKGLFVDLFLEAHDRAPNQIILDLDATDDPVHGEQEGRFFHGYYDCYCYLPLYVFCGRDLLAAKLRRANIDAAAGSVEEVARIVAQIRRRWPCVRILLRADSGFAREELMVWCETNGVDFLFGLAKTDRLIAEIKAELEQAAVQSRRTGKPARRFKDFRWRTRTSWSRQRRVVAKAEWTEDEANPRFIVTSLTRAECKARYLYEKVYCARGDMENRIKECQLDLYADRTSTATMRANQLRLWFASMAYVLLCALRRIALHHTPFAKATCGTIRLKLLKIGALVRVSVRRIKVAMASACPAADAWGCAAKRLAAAANARASPA